MALIDVKKRFFSLRYAAPLIAVISLVALFLVYYFSVIKAQEASVNEQAFRSLAAISSQFRDLINTSSTVLVGAAQRYQSEQDLAFLTAQGSRLADVRNCLGSSLAPKAFKDSNIVTAQVVPGLKGYSVELAAHGWCADVLIEDALAPLVTETPGELFDEILVIDSSSRVLYQTQHSDLVASDLSILEIPSGKAGTSDSKDKESRKVPDPQVEAGGASNIIPINLAGKDYRAYVVPIRVTVPVAGASGVGTGMKLVLCGMMLEKRFASKSRAIPLTLLAAVGLAILLVIVGAWPVLKFSTMRRSEQITRWAGAVYSVFIVMTFMVMSLLITHLHYGFLLADSKTDDNMEDLAKAIDRNVGQELHQALLVMKSVEASPQIKQAPLLEHGVQQGCRDTADDKLPQTVQDLLNTAGMEVADYPYFRRLYVFDSQGFEHVSWTVDNIAPVPLRVCDRPYFVGVQHNDLWYLSDEGPGPTLEELQKVPPAKLRTFFGKHHCRDQELIEWRILAIRQSIPAIQDRAVIEAKSTAVKVIVQLIRILLEGIADLDERIEEAAATHPDFFIFKSLPGAGPALAPRLLAAFGSQRERYRNAGEVQTYSGVAPVIEKSGKKQWIHFRWACPKFLRQSFHEWAGHSIGYSVWARAYYRQQRGKGVDHHGAVRALAFKWIRIVFRCWKERVAYDESKYLAALARRGSTLIALVATAKAL